MGLRASNGGLDTKCCGIRPRSLRFQPSSDRDAASDAAPGSVVSGPGQGADRPSGLGHGQRLSQPLSVPESDRVPSQQGPPSCGRRTFQRGWWYRCHQSGFETRCRPGSAWRRNPRADAPCVRGDQASKRPVCRLNGGEIERRPTQDGPADRPARGCDGARRHRRHRQHRRLDDRPRQSGEDHEWCAAHRD